MANEAPQPSPEDQIRIWRIVQPVDELAMIMRTSTRAQLDADLKTRKAILHSLIEIGEGVSRLSAQTKNLLPQIPWPRIIQMRNVLIHVYWGINFDRVWDAATVHAPELGAALRPLLPPELQG